MTKLQEYTVSTFLAGLIFVIIGIVLSVYKVDSIIIEPMIISGAIAMSISTILSVLNPIKK